MTARRAAVLGHPVAHSLSPALHRAAYDTLGLAGWSYDAVDVTEDRLPGFVAGLDESWAGLSLTMPLKQTVIPLLDHVEPLAQVVGAVNTVLPLGTGRARTLTGANTDVHGLVAALGEGGVTGGLRTAAVIGAGATAASTLAALAQLGCPAPRVYVRSQARAGGLLRAAHRMGVEPRLCRLEDAPAELADAEAVVSTLPAHAADPIADALPAAVTGVLLDVCYDPRPTALSVAWAAHGGRVVGGERMLLHQAAEQVRLMTGHPAPLAAMDAALGAVLAPTA